jgi:hypothetical protein
VWLGCASVWSVCCANKCSTSYSTPFFHPTHPTPTHPTQSRATFALPHPSQPSAAHPFSGGKSGALPLVSGYNPKTLAQPIQPAKIHPTGPQPKRHILENSSTKPQKGTSIVQGMGCVPPTCCHSPESNVLRLLLLCTFLLDFKPC